MKDTAGIDTLMLLFLFRSIQNLEKEYPSGIPACGTDALRYALIAYTQQVR